MKKVLGFIRCLFCFRRRCRARFRVGKDGYGGCGIGFITLICPKDREK